MFFDANALIFDLWAMVSDSNIDILFTAVFCLMYYSESNLSDLDLQESEISPPQKTANQSSLWSVNLTQYSTSGANVSKADNYKILNYKFFYMQLYPGTVTGLLNLLTFILSFTFVLWKRYWKSENIFPFEKLSYFSLYFQLL